MEEIIAIIHRERCIACGLCELKAPGIFAYDNEGIACFRHTQNLDNPTKKAIAEAELSAFKDALTHCPTGAISRLKNQTSNANNEPFS